MTCDQILRKLRSLAGPEVVVAGIARFGINARNAYGISVPELRRLAQELWASRIHEACALARMIDDPNQVTEAQMERWVREFDSWNKSEKILGRNETGITEPIYPGPSYSPPLSWHSGTGLWLREEPREPWRPGDRLPGKPSERLLE